MAKTGELGGSFGDNRTSRFISPVGRRCRDAQTFPKNEQGDVLNLSYRLHFDRGKAAALPYRNWG
jgi:hypothetical protein